MTRVRGIRGATTAEDNSKEAILQATKELLSAIVDANDLDVDDIAAGLFTTTEDLNAEFPAAAARQMGWEYVALMCGHEMKVPDGPPGCVRILLLVNTDKRADEIQNVYLKGTKVLRERTMDGTGSLEGQR